MPIIREVVDLKLGPDGEKELEKYVYDYCSSLRKSTSNLREQKVVKWRELYEGKPKYENKSWPWPNCANLVIQVVGTYVDTMKARIIGSIYPILPLWTTALVGEWRPEEKGEEQRSAIEELMNLMALEPHELDMYRVESQGFHNCINLGTNVWKFPWETEIEALCIGERDGRAVFQNITRYDGPRPESLPFENFLINEKATTIESAEFKDHIRPLKKFQLEKRRYDGVYKEEAINKIINTPDRGGPTPQEVKEQQAQGITPSQDFSQAEWDIDECWFPWFHNGQTFRIIVSYHYSSRTILRAIYNFYPQNDEPFECARMGYTNDRFHGHGFAELLEHYQEEIATMHGQRIDNNTLANTSVLRAGANSRIDSNFSLYAGATIPAEQNEVEVMNIGRQGTPNIDDEKLTLSLASDRVGIQPATTGSGGGITNPKKGIYSAMGTFAVMQEGNSRVNINVTDMRYAHLKMGRKFLRYYAENGIGDRAQYFGKRAEIIKKALDNIKEGRLHLPIRAATGSINRELEKQNDMLLVNVMERHYMSIAQIVQSMSMNAQMPSELKDFLTKKIIASNFLMEHILRNFGHDDTSRLLPKPAFLEQKEQQENVLDTSNRVVTSANIPTSESTGVNTIPETTPAQGSSPAMVTGAGGTDIPRIS